MFIRNKAIVRVMSLYPLAQNRMPCSNQLRTTLKPIRNFCFSKSRAVRRHLPTHEQDNIRKAKNLLVMASSCKIRNQFHKLFPEIMESLKSSPVFQELPSMEEWIGKIVEYNLQGGKMNRGVALVESYMILQNYETSEENLKISIALGWAVEMLQAFFLVADDIMDNSITRRMKPCWYQTNNLGVKAFNDAILLESLVYQLIFSYCKEKPYYLPVLELFHDITMRTSLGQAMDLHSAPNANEKPDLSKFTLKTYDAIVKYKTGYYSFFLPVAIAMRMAGIQDKQLFKCAEDILLPMGRFFQVQDDYLDCFGDPGITGKIGTDIEDGKCTWLIVTALALCDSPNRQLIELHYGCKDSESVELIKSIYQQLGIPKLYTEYEEKSFKQLTGMIEKIEEQLPTSVFHGFMAKIYKRLN